MRGSLMTEMSLGFNFDDFDAQVAEALEENDRAMRPLRPGAIGSVPVRLTCDLDEQPVIMEESI